MNRIYRSPTTVLLAIAIAVVIPSLVGAQCLSGTSTATPTPGNSLGDWKYTIDITWGPLSNGLSHFNVILGLADCDCACDDFPFGVDSIAGISDGEDDCTVDYVSEFLCDDPSIPGVEGPLVKFDADSDDCEPGKSGTGAFCFYSDWPPGNIPTPNALGQIKYAGNNCTGQLTGQLPVCGCESTSTESGSWSNIKGMFR